MRRGAPPRPALAASPQWSGPGTSFRCPAGPRAAGSCPPGSGSRGRPPRSTSVVWAAPPPCAAPGCPATASSLPRGRPACRPQRLQRPQPLREALRQPLRQQAVRLHLREVPRRRIQDAPGLGHHAVLKAQHRVVDGAVGAVAQQPPHVDEVPHHAPLVGEGLGEVRARAVQLAAAAAHAVDHLRAARPQAYHRVPCAPRLATRRPCAPARAAASPRPRGSARRCPTRCGPSGRRPAPASRPAKPSGTSREAGLPRVAAALHKAQVRQHAVHGLNAVRRAQDGQGEGGVGQPVAPATHHVHADVQRVLCARLRLKNQRRQLGAPDVLHDAGGHAALQTRGLRALSQRLLAVAVAAQRLQSLHAARKGLPHRRHVVQLAGGQPAAAQGALAALPGQGLLPLRRTGHLSFRLEQLQEDLVRQPGQPLAPVLLPQCLAPPLQHLVLLRQLSDPCAPPQPQPAVLRRAADGHLGALANGHKLAPPRTRTGPAARPWRQSASTLRWAAGLPRLAPVEHARRLPLQHPLHGPVHVAVPVKGQEAHGAVLLQRRVVAVHQVALRAQHAHRRVAPHAELSHLLGGDAEAPPVVEQHGVKVGAHLLHTQLQQLGQLPGHAERLVLEGARQHVLLAGQLEAHAPRAPHALAQERLHLGPGVPILRALGADHPVPLRVEEVGLVRVAERGLHLLPDPLRHLLLREVGRVPRHGAAQLVHRQPVPALVARARVPPAAPPATDDHRHVDQVLVVLVAEEALAQLGQPVLSVQGAHELLLPVAQQDVVVGPLSDEGLVVVEVLAGRPQAQVGVVVLARPGQLPVRAREQRVGPRAAPQVQHDGTIRPRASPGAAVRGLRDLLSLSRPTCHSFFTGPVFSGWRILPNHTCRYGRGE